VQASLGVSLSHPQLGRIGAHLQVPVRRIGPGSGAQFGQEMARMLDEPRGSGVSTGEDLESGVEVVCRESECLSTEFAPGSFHKASLSENGTR
jgi:hypothetical protein